MSFFNSVAASATIHCLAGCSIGEVSGLVIGEILGFSTIRTIILAVGLAFVFGYAMSLLPLLKSDMEFKDAVKIVLAADTLSILIMEITDNAVMVVIPGAMESGIVNPVFWLSMSLALTAAFVAAYPVNKYLISKNKGHALMHEHH